MTPREFRTRLHQDECLFGTLIVSPAPEWLRVVKMLPLDYVFLDTEHVALDRAALSWLCQAYREAGIPSIVRIPSPDPYQACMALDGGASAVLAPYVESVEQIEALVGAVKQRPIKGEKLQRLLAGESRPAEEQDYLDAFNAGNSLLVNIESVPAVNRLDRLLAVPGVDGVIVGPHDLSTSLGVPERWDSTVFQQAVEAVIRSARAHGLAAGVHMIYENGMEDELRWIGLGANLILHQADILAFCFAMNRDLAVLRQAAGGGSDGAASREGSYTM
jgi:2-keto-3-deoxy-L-rhamnonate aldolase RhmA